MARIIKEPEERKEELIDAAEELFIVKGYENTSINDIVDKVGVAKGLFYYYFKAKDEILNAISNKYVQYIGGRLKGIVENEEKNAVEKIHQIMEAVINQFGLQSKGIRRLAWLFNKERNTAIHSRLATKTVAEITPYIISILKQGIQEGVFKTENPEFTAETMLMWAVSLHNTINIPIADSREAELKAKAAEDIIERILGAERGSLHLFPYFKAIIDELKGF